MKASFLIDERIAELGDWRGERLTRIRQMIHEVEPGITEEWKWDSPVFSHNGMVCSLGSFADHVKITFFQGASLPDVNGLFNSGLEAKKTRSIDIFKDDQLSEEPLKDLFRIAITYNDLKAK